MQLEFDYWYFKQSLPKLWCRDIISFAKSTNDSQFAVVAGVKGVDKNSKKLSKTQKEKTLRTRNSKVVWLKEPWITNKILPFMKTANKNAGWNCVIEDCEARQFTRYEKGQY